MHFLLEKRVAPFSRGHFPVFRAELIAAHRDDGMFGDKFSTEYAVDVTQRPEKVKTILKE